MSEIKVKKLRENAMLPIYSSDKAAGADLYACVDGVGLIAIEPHTTQKIGIGLAMELPEGYFGAIFARSGLATKQGLRPANCVGVVDEDYRGEIMVALHNDTDEIKNVKSGERIAQLVLLPYIQCDFVEDELSETERGDGGFGSTGK
jgi:dUTP pyrophosphatase